MDGHDSTQNGNKSIAKLPQFLTSGSGRVSLAALLEQVESQFLAEVANRADILLHADDQARHTMIREVVDYVLAIETISLSRSDRLLVQDIAYRDMFGFGPLYDYITDPAVTEITIDGAERIHVRHGAEDMETVDIRFDDAYHLERVVIGILTTAQAELTSSEPILEVGTQIEQRPVRIAVIAPPVSPTLHLDIRLQPREAATRESCLASGLIEQSSLDLLRAVIAAGHGLMIAGDVGTGKTTLLEALLPLLPEQTVVVERVPELRVPEAMLRFAAVPPSSEQAPISFAEQIDAALEHKPGCLVLDELRFDEAPAMWRALTAGSAPQCLWIFRGATQALRLRSAFNMSVRRAVPGIDQEVINSALLDRLPFVALMARQGGTLKLISINEWQKDQIQTDTLSLVQLWPAAGNHPVHHINWLKPT